MPDVDEQGEALSFARGKRALRVAQAIVHDIEADARQVGGRRLAISRVRLRSYCTSSAPTCAR